MRLCITSIIKMHILIIQGFLQSDLANAVQNNYDGRSLSPLQQSILSILIHLGELQTVKTHHQHICTPLPDSLWLILLNRTPVSVRLIMTMTIVCYGHQILHVDGCTTPCVLIHHSAMCLLPYINNGEKGRGKARISTECIMLPYKPSADII